MTLNDAVTRVCNRLNKNVNDSVVTTRIKMHINDTCQEMWDGHGWTFRYREYLLPMVADINSGNNNTYTVTATANSQSITFSTAVLPDTTTFVGGYIRFTADAPLQFYRIVACPTTSTAIIEPAYQGTTGSSKQFFLKKIDYLFPSELVDCKNAGIPIYFPRLEIFWNVDPPDVNYGVPNSVYIYNSDFIGSTYTTGTVTGTSGTNTLTGSGTAWLANVSPGDTITITGDSSTIGAVTGVLTRYTVYKVSSDTSITLYQNLLTSPSAATYTSTKQFGRYLRVNPSPNNVWGVLVGGYRKYAYLINNTDTNDILYRFPNAVIEGAIWREEGSSPDMREGSQLSVYKAFWDGAKAEDREVSRRFNRFPLFSNRRILGYNR